MFEKTIEHNSFNEYFKDQNARWKHSLSSLEECRSLQFTIMKRQLLSSMKNEEDITLQEKDSAKFIKGLQLLEKKEELATKSIQTGVIMELERHYNELTCLKLNLENSIIITEIVVSTQDYEKILNINKTLNKLARQIKDLQK